MTRGTIISIENHSPKDTWTGLENNPKSALVDCRTKMEWDRIGTPDLNRIGKTTHLIEWRVQPDMSFNPNFGEELEASFQGEFPETLYFLCRSGARSYEAATFVQNILSSKNIKCTCINVAEGFEGDPDSSGQRGTVNGWKFNNLPWQIS